MHEQFQTLINSIFLQKSPKNVLFFTVETVCEWDCGFDLCIPETMKCDGIAQCPNLSDEEDCCLDGHLCGDGACIPLWKLCNGEFDCIDGSDEISCSKYLKAMF